MANVTIRAEREGAAVPSGLSALELLEARGDEIAEYLREIGADCARAQRHLDQGTEARAYWHFGYYMAVRDVLALLGSTSTPRH